MLVHQNSKLQQITYLPLYIRLPFSTDKNRLKFIKSHSCIFFALTAKRELRRKRKTEKDSAVGGN